MSRTPIGYKVRLYFAATLLFGCISSASALERDFGFGIKLGSPASLSAALNLDSATALQGAIGIDIGDLLVLEADYLFRVGGLVSVPESYGQFWLYYGPGVRLELGHRAGFFTGPYRSLPNGGLGLRFPVGVQYQIPKIPFEVFYEIAPMFYVLPKTLPDAAFALGIRFQI